MKQRKPADPRGHHIRVYSDLLNSHAWRVLSGTAVKLFIDMRSWLKENNNGNINATLSQLRHKGWSSPDTLSRGLFELQTMGFIAKTRQGGIAQGKHVCSLFRFTDRAVFEHPLLGIKAMPETNDYRRFEGVAHAKAHMRDALATRNTERQQRKARCKDKSNYGIRISPATESVSVASSGCYGIRTTECRTASESVSGKRKAKCSQVSGRKSKDRARE
jgi:hypothetical protein